MNKVKLFICFYSVEKDMEDRDFIKNTIIDLDKKIDTIEQVNKTKKKIIKVIKETFNIT